MTKNDWIKKAETYRQDSLTIEELYSLKDYPNDGLNNQYIARLNNNTYQWLEYKCLSQSFEWFSSFSNNEKNNLILIYVK